VGPPAARRRATTFGFVDAVGVLPSIVPVNYLLDNDRIVFGPMRAANLPPHSAVPQSRSRWTAWTKTTKSAGASWCAVTAEEITDEDKLAELRQTPLLAWHPRAKPPLYTNQP
jgi:hypothetical protein